MEIRVGIKHLQLALRFLREARDKMAQMEAAHEDEVAAAYANGYADGYERGLSKTGGEKSTSQAFCDGYDRGYEDGINAVE